MRNILLFAIVTIALSVAARAEGIKENDVLVRMRGISIIPQESGKPSAIGGHVSIGNASVPELDFSYFFKKNFALELILATATHSVSANKTALNNVDLGSVSILPPTLLAQYHHEFGKFKPYVGAGLNYTIFYGANPGAAKNVTYSNNLGYAFQVGGDYQIAENLFLNFDVKKLYLSSDVKVVTYGSGTVNADVDVNPVIAGFGLGYRF